MWKYNQNLKCFLKDDRNVDVCEYWGYHSVMDKKRCQKGAVFPYINKKMQSAGNTYSDTRLYEITRSCVWMERNVIDERKITTVYDWQIRSG